MIYTDKNNSVAYVCVPVIFFWMWAYHSEIRNGSDGTGTSGQVMLANITFGPYAASSQAISESKWL